MIEKSWIKSCIPRYLGPLVRAIKRMLNEFMQIVIGEVRHDSTFENQNENVNNVMCVM